ncbi:hypothetical protein BDF20DRAFT_168759 [Mycotypha africana]|uniref:uncharacterized protein n=1 Tax=Mycotypha africana TaxID=64632 RepID=UPI002300E9E6|nr:uncharacterized protein BDF20DRAFT_168759 [Mycotypha africana]KAI8968240.1 hypothetical protein BDF20DRAFT_168759 [Mycotypha africana]
MYLKEVQQFIKASKIEILRTESVPATTQWTSKVINDQLKILVPSNVVVRAQIENAAARGSDLTAVVKKKETQLSKKLLKIKSDIEKLKNKMSQENYQDTVPINIKEKNSLRLSQLSVEQKRTCKCIMCEHKFPFVLPYLRDRELEVWTF